MENHDMGVINRSHYKVLLFFIVSLFFLTNNSANAACKLLQAAAITFTTPSNLVIPRDTATGTVLYTSNPVFIDPTAGVSCDNYVDSKGLVNDTGGADTYTVLSAFGYNDSVGYNIMVEPGENSDQLFPFKTSTNLPMGEFRLKGFSYRLQIVKRGGAVTSGIYTNGGLIARYFYGAAETIKFYIGNQASISERTCTTRNVSVNMGSQKVSGFNGGHDSLPPVAFTINLDCGQGLNSIKYRLDPTTSILNKAGSIVALDSSSTASGIGLQILDNLGNPLPLGVDIPLSNNTAAGAGLLSIPLKAAYYKIANTVKGGIANSSLTYTMNYQ